MPHSYDRRSFFVSAADGARLAVHEHARTRRDPARGTVVLSNGIGTSENFWRFLVAALTDDFRVVHWDYRGHGASEVGTERPSMELFAGDLEHVVSALGSESIFHVAFSMGVPVVLSHQRTHHASTRALVLISGAAEPPWHQTGLFRMTGLRSRFVHALSASESLVPVVAPLVKMALRSPLSYPFGRLLGLLRSRAPREDIAQFMEALGQMDARAYWRTLLALMNADVSDVPRQLKAPTLVIAARNDWLVPLRQMERLRTRSLARSG